VTGRATSGKNDNGHPKADEVCTLHKQVPRYKKNTRQKDIMKHQNAKNNTH